MTTLPEEFEAAFPCDKGCADCLAAKIRYSARTNEITLEDVGPDDHCDDCRARYRPAAAAAFNAWVERVAGEGLEGAVEGLARAHCDCGPPPASLGDAAPHACALSIVPEIVAAVAPLLAARDRRVEELVKLLGDCRGAIANLDRDALGRATDGEDWWPIRDELLSYIDAALGRRP